MHRFFFFITFAGLMTSGNAFAQQASQTASKTAAAPVAATPAVAAPDPGLACFENLAPPEFPKSALQAHIDGSVWTWTQVSPQGTPEKVKTEVVSAWGEAPKLLIAPVEKAIRAARIKPDCAGKEVWVVFRYELHGEPVHDPKVTSRTDGPNIMWIESEPGEASQVSSNARH